MRRVRDCLRLKSSGISTREMARRRGVASSTVRLTLRRCEAADMASPLAPDISDAVPEERLFANSGTKQGRRRYCPYGKNRSAWRAALFHDSPGPRFN